MTYIDYLNDFNQWLETNALPASSQLMYYKLLHVFNRAGWPEDVGVDNLRMMLMLDGAAKTTVIKARERLIAAGFIDYKKGRKGLPNRYVLSLRYKNTTFYATENATKSATVCATKSATENATHIKTKTKTKTKNNPPKAPPLDECGFGAELTDAFSRWLIYKREKRQEYTPTGLSALITRVKKHADQYGEAAVADLIQTCMSANWQGIIWDKLKNGEPEKKDDPYQYDPGKSWEKWSL